jgi:hypothetical protein
MPLEVDGSEDALSFPLPSAKEAPQVSMGENCLVIRYHSIDGGISKIATVKFYGVKRFLNFPCEVEKDFPNKVGTVEKVSLKHYKRGEEYTVFFFSDNMVEVNYQHATVEWSE